MLVIWGIGHLSRSPGSEAGAPGELQESVIKLILSRMHLWEAVSPPAVGPQSDPCDYPLTSDVGVVEEAFP